jgi:sigma-54 dependent transcriptional regulator, acetoin dehydrogenase operon transcriptional activator AcoR
MKALCRYDWPGNVRELSNIVENAVIFTEGEILLPEVLPASIGEAATMARPAVEGSLRKYEADHICDALTRHGGNVTQVAKELGISRNTLYNRLKKHRTN